MNRYRDIPERRLNVRVLLRAPIHQRSYRTKILLASAPAMVSGCVANVQS